MYGAPQSAWFTVVGFSLFASRFVFGYNPDTLSLTEVPSCISWVIIWLLMTFSTKHRFLSAALPKFAWVRDDSKQAIAKFLWRVYGSSSTETSRPIVGRPKLASTPECLKLKGFLEDRWAQHFRRVLLDASQACKHLFSCRKNTFGLVQLALAELKHCNHVVISLDKEPGYVIVSPAVYSKMELLAMSARYYIPFPIYNLNFNTIVASYRRLAFRIGEFHNDRRVEYNINATLEFGTFVSPIGLTVKSHKVPGEQSLRTIHKGFNVSFGGLAKWVQKMLDPIVLGIPWCMKDSFSVRNTLLELSLNASVSILKIDLKDFFLSGKPHHVSQVIANLFEPGDLKDLIQEAVFMLLEYQFVVTHTLGSTYRCVLGSGIGLLASAAIATCFFYGYVEKGYIHNIKGLVCWIRYHDDVLAVYRSRALAKLSFANLKLRCNGIFVMKCESMHSLGSTFSFLDLSVKVCIPNFLVSALQEKHIKPLSPSSAHADSVHSSWPRAVAKRVHTLSGGSSLAMQTLIHRYKMAGADPATISSLVSWNLRKSMPVNPGSSLPAAPLVLRYHPAFKSAFYKALKAAPPPGEIGYRIVPCWKNALPSLGGHINRLLSKSCNHRVDERVGFCCLFSNLQKQRLHEFGIKHILEVLHA